MRANPIVDNAIVDALGTLLDGIPDVHIVGTLSDVAQDRLAQSLGGRLSMADRPGPLNSRHETVVVLDPQQLGDAQATVHPEGMLTVAAANPRYGSLLVEVLDGGRAPCSAVDLEGVCDYLEREGWEVANTTPVTVPLALLPFDPTRIPKTVLAYLYARHPEIETYCFLVQARRPAIGLPRRRAHATSPPTDFPTMPWKTESEWREEARQHADGHALAPSSDPALPSSVGEGRLPAPETIERLVEELQLALRHTEDELFQIKSSLTWRAVVRYRRWREWLLPPRTRRGRLYEWVRSAIRRLALGGRDPWSA